MVVLVNLSLQCDIHNKYVYGTHTFLSHCKIVWNVLWFNGLLNSWWTNLIPIHYCNLNFPRMLLILILNYLKTKLRLFSIILFLSKIRAQFFQCWTHAIYTADQCMAVKEAHTLLEYQKAGRAQICEQGSVN